MLSARYTLCAGLDEAVLSTPWGSQSEWAQHPLLVALHREAWGGEKFFDMLDRISQDPARYIDLMELQYLGLAFGFAGKYQIQERGHEHLLEVQHELYRKIRDHRGQTEPGALAALARTGGSPQPAHPLRAVVGRRRGGARRARHRVHRLLREPRGDRRAGAGGARAGRARRLFAGPAAPCRCAARR